MKSKILFFIVFFIYNILWLILFPFIFLIFLFNPYLNFDIFKRFGFAKFKYYKNCMVVGSSSGEIKIGYDLFENKVNYLTFNKDGSLFLKNKNRSAIPIIFDFVIFTFIFLKRNRIKKIIFIEQEIWPSLIISARLLNIKIFIVNGIIYKKSLQSMKLLKFLYSYLFSLYDYIFVRDNKQKNRFSYFVNNNKLIVSGNLKLNIKKDEIIKKYEEKHKIISKFKKPIIIFASIHKEEFYFIKDIIENVYNNYYFILVPRKINESNFLKMILKNIDSNKYQKKHIIKKNNHNSNNIFNSKFKNNVVLFTEIIDKNIQIEKDNLIKLIDFAFTKHNILIVDKIGILKYLYEFSSISYIGGSFISKGGQNFIESISKYTPAIAGKYIYNFEDLFDLFKDKGIYIVDKKDVLQLFRNVKNIENLYKFLPYGIKILLENCNSKEILKKYINCE